MNKDLVLSAQKQFEVRFSEVDMMNVVWHGSYPLYLEDAREMFGIVHGLSYNMYINENVFVPIVEMKINYKRPLTYGMKPVIKITYRPTEAAKIVFDYEIHDPATGALCITAHTVQVFMDRNYHLLWDCPEFYTNWKKAVGLI
jgi:acyl-CoA thioester hydrolase